MQGLERANEQGAARVVAESGGPARLEGIADGGDGRLFERFEDGACDAGEDVGVFVGVDVRDAYTGALELSDLGEGFAGDLLGAHVAAQHGEGEGGERAAEVAAVGAE